MLNWFSRLKCDVELHRGDWAYVDPGRCDQTRICVGCGKQGFRERHKVLVWGMPDSKTRSGPCVRCGQIQTVKQSRRHHGKHPHGLRRRPERSRSNQRLGLGPRPGELGGATSAALALSKLRAAKRRPPVQRAPRPSHGSTLIT